MLQCGGPFTLAVTAMCLPSSPATLVKRGHLHLAHFHVTAFSVLKTTLKAAALCCRVSEGPDNNEVLTIKSGLDVFSATHMGLSVTFHMDEWIVEANSAVAIR